MDNAAAMELMIKLAGVHPAVYRKLVVPLSIRYDQLHVLIQLAFGWENYHLHGFHLKGQARQYVPALTGMGFDDDEILTTQAYVYPDLLQTDIVYTYDFGATWEHLISLNKIITFADLPGTALPSCVTYRGNNIPEDATYDEETGKVLPEPEKFDKAALNKKLWLWSRAGEQMVHTENLGLAPISELNEDF